MNFRGWVGFVAGMVMSLAYAQSSSSTAAEERAAGESRAKVHTELGLAYFQAGRMGTALEEAEIALHADPRYAQAYNLLGLVHLYLRETAQAQAHFEKALSLAPKDPEINNNYGWFLCQGERARDSFSYFLTAVKNPQYQTPTKAYFNAGLCALKLRDEEAAEDYLRKALMADGRNVAAAYRLAAVYYRKGALYEAQRLMQDVLRLMPADPAAIWLALRIERKLGNTETETALASQLRSKFRGTPEHQAMMQGKFE